MKKLAFRISIEMEIPDGWEIVRTSDGHECIRMESGKYLDMYFEPFLSTDRETWHGGHYDYGKDTGLVLDIIDMVRKVESSIEPLEIPR